MATVSDNAQFQKDKYICFKLYACSMKDPGFLQGAEILGEGFSEFSSKMHEIEKIEKSRKKNSWGGEVYAGPPTFVSDVKIIKKSAGCLCF